MSSLSIQLDPVALREATAQAIMGILTPEVRERLLRESVTQLLAPSTNSWDRGKSPIQQAFDNAVQQIANEIARDVVRNDPAITSKIRELLTKAFEKAVSVKEDVLVDKMVFALAGAWEKN